jgi:RecG-like helicase
VPNGNLAEQHYKVLQQYFNPLENRSACRRSEEKMREQILHDIRTGEAQVIMAPMPNSGNG